MTLFLSGFKTTLDFDFQLFNFKRFALGYINGWRVVDLYLSFYFAPSVVAVGFYN